MSQLKSKDYEPILKEALQCWRCDELLKTIPALKEHLKEHFASDTARAKKKQERMEVSKRKRDNSEVEAAPMPQKLKEA
jgi:aprataxin